MQDNKLYLCNVASIVYDVTGYQVRWIFVSPANYESYTALQMQYEAAVALGDAIEKAKTECPGIAISSVEAVYENESSTTEQLIAAKQTLAALVMEYQTERATPAAPADYTAFIVNPSYFKFRL